MLSETCTLKGGRFFKEGRGPVTSSICAMVFFRSPVPDWFHELIQLFAAIANASKRYI